MKVGLRARFFGAFAGVTAAFTLLAALAGAYLVNRATVREAEDALRLDLHSARGILQDMGDEWLLLMRVLGGGRRVGRVFADAGPATIAELEEIRREVGLDIFSVSDLAGAVLVRTTAPYHAGDLLQDAVTRRALAGEPSGGFIELDPGRIAREGAGLATRSCAERAHGHQVPCLAFLVAAPAYDQAGKHAGVVVAGVLVAESPLVGRRLRVPTSGDIPESGSARPIVSLFHGQERILTTLTAAEGNTLPARVDEGMWRSVSATGLPWFGPVRAEAGSWLAAASPLQDVNGVAVGLVAVCSPAARFAQLRRSMWAVYGGIGLAAMIAAMLVSLRLSSRLSEPIRSLASAAGTVARGDFGVRLAEPDRNDEVGELTRSFNGMAAGLRERDERLQAARSELEMANASLREVNESYITMLGFVSHELKNVLGTVTWSAQALDDGVVGPMTEPQKRLVHTIRGSVDGALAMSRNYLDLAKIETGRLDVKLKPCDLVQDVIAPIVEELREVAGRRPMRVETRLPARLPLEADRDLLAIVFRNLLGNALQYGRQNGIVRVTGQSAGGHIVCEVWNEGEGLEREQLERVFDKFRRFARTPNASRGSGLGLFIARQIVERHGGRITVASDPGAWVCFTLTLPESAPAIRASDLPDEFALDIERGGSPAGAPTE